MELLESILLFFSFVNYCKMNILYYFDFDNFLLL